MASLEGWRCNNGHGEQIVTNNGQFGPRGAAQTHLNQEIGISSKLLVIGFRIHHRCTLEANCKMKTM